MDNGEIRLIAAMLHDELRRVRDGYSTPDSLKRAMDTYERVVRQQTDPDGFLPDGYVGPGIHNLDRALASGRLKPFGD
jgi:hypothetical protein